MAVNREAWTRANRDHTDARAHGAWSKPEMDWGVWAVPESEVGVLPDVEGMDVVELGCGTAYFGAWLAKRGARVVGVDITPAQLATARRLEGEFSLGMQFVEANAEETGLPDASFDLALSEYGASIWVDPFRWIPEAARLLRPGGRLIFLCNSPLAMLTIPLDDEDAPSDERLHRPQRGMHRFDWTDGSVEFHLGHGDWIRVLRSSGFEIEDLIEVYAPDGASDGTEYLTVE
ncbi:MAG: class I SAM-dependent methyltransferase, partial [Gaiellaceae bacterium]